MTASSGTFGCWHHYVTDVDGQSFCDRCGDCPAERAREAELEAIEQAQALGPPDPIGYIITGE
jgi:hypothetical protein